jgi:hypothetical protein
MQHTIANDSEQIRLLQLQSEADDLNSSTYVKNKFTIFCLSPRYYMSKYYWRNSHVLNGSSLRMIVVFMGLVGSWFEGKVQTMSRTLTYWEVACCRKVTNNNTLAWILTLLIWPEICEFMHDLRRIWDLIGDLPLFSSQWLNSRCDLQFLRAYETAEFVTRSHSWTTVLCTSISS